MAHQNYKYKYTNDRNRRYLLNIEHNINQLIEFLYYIHSKFF